MKLNAKLAITLAAALCTQVAQSTTVWLFNGTNNPIKTWVNCSLVHDSKNNPYTIYPQWRLSIPFIQKPFCNIGNSEWGNGFYWLDGENKCWKANEVTELAILGNDLFIIGDNGTYTRIILPSGLLPVDLGRLIGEKLVDLVTAIKQNQPLDAFFNTIGIPGASISVNKQAEPRDIAQLY